MNTRKHSRLRNLQQRRKCQRLLDGLVNYVYRENKEAIDRHIDTLMNGGVSKLSLTDAGKWECSAINTESATPSSEAEAPPR